MKFKIICADLDGTLLTSKSDVSDFTVSEISRIKEHLRIILVSARMPQSMTYLQRRLGIEKEPLICYNGALILDGEKEISSTTIEMAYVDLIYNLSNEHSVKLGLYHKKEWFVEENTDRVRKEIHNTHATPYFKETKATIKDWKEKNKGPHKIMLMGVKESIHILFMELQKNLGAKLNIYRSNDTLIEMAPKSVSKISAIKLLLKEGETLGQIMAFGDNYNDITMLQQVGCGVAMGNAREEVKAIANYITLKNTVDGVAHFIKQHILF